jgi:hypothetical protein
VEEYRSGVVIILLVKAPVGDVFSVSGKSCSITLASRLSNWFSRSPPLHMASGLYASRFDICAILIMDGAGEAACTTSGQGQGERITKINEHLLPHSLGHFYSAVTGYLGFKMLDGEYKLMGLSPYGDPSVPGGSARTAAQRRPGPISLGKR